MPGCESNVRSEGRTGPFSIIGVVAVILFTTTPILAQWPQWGGPNRDFTATAAKLADSWPEAGPRRLWHRELGVGYSAIAVDDGMVYTMYRKDLPSKDEVTVALDAATGQTIWEHANPAAPAVPPDQRWGGQGPNSTPLVVGDRLYTVGSNAVIHCFDKKTGQVFWTHALVKEFNAKRSPNVGYCPSPLAYQDMIVVAVGRHREDGEENEENKERGQSDGQGLVAFDQNTGSVIWRSADVGVGFSSPIMINFEGQDQLVLGGLRGLVGVDPANGDLLWDYPLDQQHTVITPVWNGKDVLFCPVHGESPAGRGIRLTKKDGRTVPEELWQSRKIRFGMGTPVPIGEHFYGATDTIILGASFESGKRVWAKRGFPNASVVYGDGKLLILDEHGELTLATMTPEGLTIHSQCKITEKYSLTAPALVGKTLYVRDRKHIMALDLS